MISDLFVQNWKCRTSTAGTKVPPGHPSFHYLPPAVEERRTEALAPIGSLRSEWQEEIMVLLGVCAFYLPYMPGNHPFLALEY